MKMRVVFDASAVLALLFRESGSEIVERYVESCEAMISAVNLSEVQAKQQELQIPMEQTMKYLLLLGFEVVPFTAESAVKAAAMRNETKQLGLSFGDRACLSLGQQLECPVITADRAWTTINLGIEIIAIR
ncbi:type II toxin-antitoxin system VapC family toxin [Paenibacillus sp. LHD-117]|uniref:type II toxin-antitoxin system VapC family toxin n=1 Tax=Paenibacillus sp. LHD-117 TaxID=3071412 RepID=UPI0027E03419|nr:type II toxin-antitoxin system VapC family toxin [Paenibacillus sp. LHD-117]MDQ6423126.1 type II toxin-antitoxin system VapC family toxin [Paenibacillus sp. LHD-117]